MGAENFEHRIRVKPWSTAEEAFNDAVDQAHYDVGHSGYSGTIAEKDDFVVIAEAAQGLPLEDARELAYNLIAASDPRVDDKWGPAGCIPVVNKAGEIIEYLFFGWASS